MLKRVLLSLLLFGAVACGSGSSTTPSPSPTPSTPTTFSLTGQVTDSTTAAPVSGVTVAVADGPNVGKSTTTDASGNYSLAGLQQSGFTVTASAANYVTQSKGVTLTSSQTLAFQLVRSAFKLSGTVRDQAGATLADASVGVTDGANAGKSTTSDTSGRYTLSNLSPGSFTVKASKSGYDSAQAVLSVTADTAKDFVLSKTVAQTYTVDGSVRESGGGTLGGARVEVRDGANVGMAADTNSSGNYTLDRLLSGGCTIRASRSGYYSYDKYINITGSVRLDFSLNREMTCSGVVAPQSVSCPTGNGTPTAKCNDGTWSCSQTPSGTCSYHDGVACWVCPGPLCR
jgi:Carboxypeptidase regulatory-like domain/Protein of unknown function (DUF3761)